MNRAPPDERAIVDRVFDRARALDLTDSTVADAVHISRAAVAKWRQTGSIPTRHLAPLRKLLHVSLDWLILGSAARTSTGVDAALLAEMAAALRTLERKNSIDMTAEKFGALIALLYDESAAHGIDIERMDAMMRLAS